MDGYAVRAADGARTRPSCCRSRDDIPAGRTDVPPLRPGTAHRIMTGAPMPGRGRRGRPGRAHRRRHRAGADRRAAPVGTHVRPAGEDVGAGEVVLAPARCSGRPARAAVGARAAEVAVRAGRARARAVDRLRAGRSRARRCGPGRSTSPTGRCWPRRVRGGGRARATLLHVRGRRRRRVPRRARARTWTDVDLVMTSGGVSAGAYEVVKDALTGQGVTFVKVAMQPGMPQGAGRYRGVPVVTLPGNPVSAMVSFEVFVRPAVRAAMGLRGRRPPRGAGRADRVAAVTGRQTSVPAWGSRHIGAACNGPSAGAAGLPPPALAGRLERPARRRRPDVAALAAGDTVDVWPVG